MCVIKLLKVQFTMKKVLLTAAVGALLSMPVAAQNSTVPSASRELYNFAQYDALALLKYFYELEQQGRKFPTATEFKAKFGVEPEFIRSHVRKRDVLTGTENSTRLFPTLREGRTVFLNLPVGTERTTGGYPSAQFDNDPFSLWQYTDLYGAWNHGFFQAPGSWADAAHKHGVDMMSGIVFFDTTGNPGGVGSETFQSTFLEQTSTGDFKYARPLIHLLMYLGLDGINYNWEASGYTNGNVVNFHKTLRNYAKELGFTNYRQAIYTSYSYLTDDYANAWLWDTDKGHNIGDIMLNYSGGDFATGHAQLSANLALSKTGSYDHLYNGAWIVTMDRAFQTMESLPNNLCLWGEHAVSRFVSNNEGATQTEKMANLQKLFERAFSGGNRNAALKQEWGRSDWSDKLQNFGGMSRMVPERTTLKQNLPFRTNFNSGAGERYFYKGKTASAGSWYNMASQDLQPTFRWVQYAKGTKNAVAPVQVEYTYDDAYMGGSSLRFKGNGDVDVILYRGLVTVGSTNPQATLAFKAVDETNKTNKLQLILHKSGAAETDYLVYPFADLQGKTWESQTRALTGLNQGDVIDYIGIRMESGAQDIYLGEISITDDYTVSKLPSQPKDLRAEVKMETPKSLSVMLAWAADAQDGVSPTRANHDLIYNDEAGVHHFEILYKEGEDGTVRQLGTTSSWGTYVPTVMFEQNAEETEKKPYFGVRSVANDLKTVSKITWIRVDRQESFMLPDEDRYCRSELNPNAEGAAVARRIRYLDLVETTGATTNLQYTASAPDTDGDNYVYYKNGNLTVAQGSTIDFKFRAYGREVAPGTATRDGLQWCWAATYIDWNNDGVFDAEAGSDEAISALDLGTARKATPEFQTTGVTKSFTIPTDATPGKVRVRVIFTDAWFPKPTPCAQTSKGFTFDFDMTITGTNAGRESTDKRDAGAPEQPETLAGSADPSSSEVLSRESNYSSVYPNPATNVLHFNNADRAWIFSLEGVLVRSVSDASTSVDVSALPAGTYVVKTEKAGVTRSHKVVKK